MPTTDKGHQGVDVAAFTTFEREGWDRVGPAYHQFLGPVTAVAAGPLLDAAGVGPGTHVLDLATGPGYVAGEAASRGAVPTGVDLSPEILALARRLHPGVTFCTGDALHLPFAPGSFDAAVAGFLVPHLADHRGALAELHRVLRPGGALALSTWGPREEVPLLGAVAAAVAEVNPPPPPGFPSGPPFFTYATPPSLTALVRPAGFTQVRVASHRFTHRVGSGEALWEGVLRGSVRTSALVTAQPPDVQRQIRAAFDRMVEAYDDHGALLLPVTVLVVSGRAG